MRIPFLSLPGHHDDTPRPVLGVEVAGLQGVPLACLVDTGGLHNRFAAWVAEWADVDLAGIPTESLGIGGRSVIGRTATVPLTAAGHAWEAPVTFCDPWPFDFHLLGQAGFFRWFEVCVRAADEELEVTPAG